jgi:hypothetical protein
MKTQKNSTEKFELEFNYIAVNKVIMYSFNYENQFLENIYSSSMASQLRSKFNNLCVRFGNSQTAFMYLYTELDKENRKLLINYILTNFKG